MDFLKTLLAYMALLTTLGVQEGPAPQDVPTPTPLPAHITATPVPNQTAAPTATPSPSSAPAPTLTPNKRYEKVAFGDSGASVRKLQNALIDLGYMPKNSADGQYGYQTYNAVKAFQKANGLQVDGVAGPATLTNLYENPNVVGVATETPVPTATPTPSLPPLPTPDASSAQETQSEQELQLTAAVTVAPAATIAPVAPIQPALTLLADAHIISGNDGKELYREVLVNEVSTQVRPGLWVDGSGNAAASLSQLADCLGWSLMGSSADGLYTLNACGYTVSIQLQTTGLTVLVDGEPVVIPAADAFLQDDVLYVTADFLHAALNADTVFDADEQSLVLFLKDKSVADAQD